MRSKVPYIIQGFLLSSAERQTLELLKNILVEYKVNFLTHSETKQSFLTEASMSRHCVQTA